MEEKRRTNNWIWSILINTAVFAAVLLSTKMAYETNDDFAIASRIVDGYPEVFFVNYYLALLLTKLQALMPVLNAHVIVMIVMSFISFVCILKLVMDKSRHWAVTCAAVAVIAVFSFDHYSTIQFSKTSALVMAAASIMLIDAFTEKKGPLSYIIGTVLLYYAAALRIDSYLVGIGFAGLYFLFWLAENRKEFKDRMGGKRLVVFLILMVVVAGCGASELASRKMNSRTEELAEYSEYNYIRGEVVDYSRLDYYDEQKEEYDKAGFSENDIALVRKWYFDYDGAASMDNLETILEISKSYAGDKMTLKKAANDFYEDLKDSFSDRDLAAAHIVMLMALALFLLLFAKPPIRKFLVIAIGLAVISLHIYLYMIQRPAYRAMYVPDVCAAMWLLYIMAGTEIKGKPGVTAALAVAVISALMIVPAYRSAEPLYQSAERRIMPEELSEFLQENSDAFYVTSASEKSSNPSYLTPWKAPDTELEKNYMGAGSWGAMSPYLLDKLDAYGLENPVKDLLNIPNAYYLGNKNIDRLAEYYNKWYPEDGRIVSMQKIGEVAGMGIWKPEYE